MVKFTYNNQTFYINETDSLQKLLSYSELLKLPLAAWKEILELKDGICFLDTLLVILQSLINSYDSTTKSFLHNDKSNWFSKEERTSLWNLLKCNLDQISLVVGDETISLTKEEFEKFLINLETYSQQCFLNTNKHLQAVKDIKTVDDAINYDFTSGYPDKIVL